jgi:uncharacterized repeat protein (TIGR02543 family)
MYTVTFDANGGTVLHSSGNHVQVMYRYTYNYEEKVSLPIPVRKGYEFAGWFTLPVGGEMVSDPFAVTRDVILYAQWAVEVLGVLSVEVDTKTFEITINAFNEYAQYYWFLSETDGHGFNGHTTLQDLLAAGILAVEENGFDCSEFDALPGQFVFVLQVVDNRVVAIGMALLESPDDPEDPEEEAE